MSTVSADQEAMQEVQRVLAEGNGSLSGKRTPRMERYISRTLRKMQLDVDNALNDDEEIGRDENEGSSGQAVTEDANGQVGRSLDANNGEEVSIKVKSEEENDGQVEMQDHDGQIIMESTVGIIIGFTDACCLKFNSIFGAVCFDF